MQLSGCSEFTPRHVLAQLLNVRYIAFVNLA